MLQGRIGGQVAVHALAVDAQVFAGNRVVLHDGAQEHLGALFQVVVLVIIAQVGAEVRVVHEGVSEPRHFQVDVVERVAPLVKHGHIGVRFHEFKRDEALFKKHALVQEQVRVFHNGFQFIGLQGVADGLVERGGEVDAVNELRGQLVGALAQHERRNEPLQDADVGVKRCHFFGDAGRRPVNVVVEGEARLGGDALHPLRRPYERGFNDLFAAVQRFVVGFVHWKILRDDPGFVKERFLE